MVVRWSYVRICTVFFACAAIFLVFLGTTFAQGLRKATPEEQRQMQARGLPVTDVITEADAQKLTLGGVKDFLTQLKSKSPCNKNPQNLAYRTKNTGAQVCGSTSKKWNAVGCHSNNNTAIFPTHSHGFAAHVDLLRRFCATQGRCTINGLFGPRGGGSYAAGPASQQNMYVNFVSRYSGVPANQVFNPNDPGIMARIATSSACLEGGGFPWSPDEIEKGLSMAFGGPSVPMPANVGQIIQEATAGTPLGSFANQIFGGAAQNQNPLQSMFGGGGNGFSPQSFGGGSGSGSGSGSGGGQSGGSSGGGAGAQPGPTAQLSMLPFNNPTPQQDAFTTATGAQSTVTASDEGMADEESVATISCISDAGRVRVKWSCVAGTSVSRGLASPSDSTFTTRGTLAGIVTVNPRALTTYTVQCIKNQQIVGSQSCKLKPGSQSRVGVDAVSNRTSVTSNKEMVLSISADPVSVRRGKRATIAWSTLRASACTVYGEGLAAEGEDGEEETDPLRAVGSYVYTLECEDVSGDTQTARARVDVH